MKLTGKLLTQFEESMRITLTPEQRVILLHWYKYEPRWHVYDEEEFVYGIDFVRKHYPDHRPKKEPVIPNFLRKSEPEDETF